MASLTGRLHSTAGGRAVLTLAAVGAALLLSACGSSKGTSSGSSGGSGGGGGKSIAIASVQNIGDNGPEDALNAGLKAAGKKYGASTRFVYISNPSAYRSSLESLGRAHTAIVVVPFPQLQSAVKAVAPSFPDTKFIEIYADPFKPAMKNVVTVTFDEYKLHYLLGVEAATLSSSGKIGYVGGEPQPPALADYHAYVAGAKSVDPKVNVVGAYVGSFSDPNQGSLIGKSMTAKGVDTFVTDAAESSLGVIKAARSAKALVLTDLGESSFAEYKTTIVGNQTLLWEKLVGAQIDAAQRPGWKGASLTSGLEDGIAVIQSSPAFLDSGSPEAVSKLKAAQRKATELRQKIISREITVPYDTGKL